MTYGYVLMVLASAAMATGGLLIDSAAIVIGSMCVAPFLGPSRAVCIGGLFRNRKIFLGGLTQTIVWFVDPRFFRGGIHYYRFAKI